MKTVSIAEFGGPDVLHAAEAPTPRPGAGQVLVRVHAVGVNPMDSRIRSGAFNAVFPTPLPAVLGLEFAGTIRQLGDDVIGVEVGDRVVGWATGSTGSYAEYVVSDDYVSIPEGVSFSQAVAVPIATDTASRVLGELAVTAGETLLINGASGAVGAIATQLAVELGAHVIGTAGAANLHGVRALGADAIEYGAGLAERIRSITPRVDAVFDVAGKGALPDAIALRGGTERIITIADPAAHGLGVRFSADDGSGHNLAAITSVLDGIARGNVTVSVAHTLPLDQAAEAHRISDDGHPGGKIVLEP
ncbi:NADP-dependent oxidoreductase [Microbacterium rhizophilus]|uniref:NADP-dependent oxidoreductase n=1 Tax=Microbacterium rhizophilus TaxID=3138934 RepID=UPI0031EABC11